MSRDLFGLEPWQEALLDDWIQASMDDPEEAEE